MITKRLAILVAVIVGIFCSIFLLPRQLGYQPVGLALDLPEYMGKWWGRETEVTERERTTLGHDTEFARRLYFDGGGSYVHTSIVLAGQDMMTSIHRPERCLYAQGWSTGSSSPRTIDVPGVGKIDATRLQIWRNEMIPAHDDKPAEVRKIQSVAYYWFVGFHELCASHEERVWIDLRDRLVHGYNQRWAMVMLTSEITADKFKFGRDEKQTDELVTSFVKELAPKILKPSVFEQTQRSAEAEKQVPASGKSESSEPRLARKE